MAYWVYENWRAAGHRANPQLAVCRGYRPSVTTVDAVIERTDGSARIEFHNGLKGGPAMEILQRAIDAVHAGQASGRGELGIADVTVTGAVLRRILNGITGGTGYDDTSSLEEVEAFRCQIEDAAKYHVFAIDF
jgi:hypothetical protein